MKTRYKGKRVRVKQHKLFSEELIKVVEGKCIYCHQATSIRDTDWFTVRDDKGIEHEFGSGEDNFSIEIIKENEVQKVKKIKCQELISVPGYLGGIGECSRKAKYKVVNSLITRNGKKEVKYVCGIHIKKYYYNYNKKLMFKHLEITLIKETK